MSVLLYLHDQIKRSVDSHYRGIVHFLFLQSVFCSQYGHSLAQTHSQKHKNAVLMIRWPTVRVFIINT